MILINHIQHVSVFGQPWDFVCVKRLTINSVGETVRKENHDQYTVLVDYNKYNCYMANCMLYVAFTCRLLTASGAAVITTMK